MNPTFLEIWAEEAWQPRRHPRRYYKVRSLIRMAFWIPLVYLTVCMFLSLGA